jgi:hypothetical protein
MQDYNRKDFVWHHHQDGKTMMLIPRSVHSVVQGGGRSFWGSCCYQT